MGLRVFELLFVLEQQVCRRHCRRELWEGRVAGLGLVTGGLGAGCTHGARGPLMLRAGAVDGGVITVLQTLSDGLELARRLASCGFPLTCGWDTTNDFSRLSDHSVELQQVMIADCFQGRSGPVQEPVNGSTVDKGRVLAEVALQLVTRGAHEK